VRSFLALRLNGPDLGTRHPAKALPRLLLLLLLLSAVAVGGCEQVQALAQSRAFAQRGEIRLEETRTIPLHVLQAPGGGVLAFVPVSINGQGPYDFALDTGVSHSVVDSKIVEQLGLESVGLSGHITGVAGATQASLYGVEQWRLGDIELPATFVVAIDLPEAANPGLLDRVVGGETLEHGLQGLLGSDILSRFGAITIDYDRKELILRPRGQ
jgi:hypothetical protein